MNFLEKVDNHTFNLLINVKPNSKKQEIIDNGKFLTVHVRSKAIKNHANNELLRLLKNKLKVASNHISIVSGLKSKDKIIKIKFSKEQTKQSFLERLFN
ncbi:MAG: DUF167 family protein [Promethearchaeota archaeon]